ncbi:MAG: transcriptional regulator [Gammaproteobacteria bacterium]|nr:transcriptional regulator [Gammaproteobacteria bacterium]
MSVDEIGKTVRSTRRSLGVTQRELAMAAGTGLRFVIDLEKGKPTCQLGKTLAVMGTLGVEVAFEKRDARGV